ncbi:MAG: MBL fold metallo-hydrolase [Actinobacteria bacterium]|nr:MBL fold metallo-hydrolase [Actinomycetota bacterium]MCB8998249.1 MBL fold metallo-hydrolase [Actinomycetota bacterium]HRY08951.1 MBL fold metallo-hydrolase [Candidatus Nanopelagicales bacterium]
MDVSLTFLGAAGTVTGSKFLVGADSSQFLVDAGLFQGLKALRRRNWDPLGFPATSLRGVVVSHAHLDHCGYLPALVRQGFNGPILLSADTAALAEIVLRDSAKLQMEDAKYASSRGYSKHRPPKPLYDADDVERTLPLFQIVDFDTPVPLGGGVTVRLPAAGHILGSASPVLTADGVTLAFSGDLGRANHPLLRPPAPPPAASAIIVESTYGDRIHPPHPQQALADAINRTVDRGGSVVIPAFAVDRTELLVLALQDLTRAGRIPRLPIFLDSPMALRGLQVYQAAVARGSGDVRPDLPVDLLSDSDVHEAHSTTQSQALNDPAEPSIIISASGMASGGRVLHHLKQMLPDPRHSVLLVGYQAVGTRGRDLVDGATQVKIHGEYVPVRAEVVDVQGFSVHADADELLAWLASAPEPPQVTYVVHGEPAASAELARRIGAELGWLAVVPRDGERVRVR